jgi:hypothetical protein
MPRSARPMGPRWRMGAPKAPEPKTTKAEDYRVEVSSFRSSGQFYARIRIERLTDKKVIYPFEGAETLGPYESSDKAREAGQVRARELVDADIKSPE